jgi:hypothetical protein
MQNRHNWPMSAVLRVCKILCFAGPIGLYLHQPGDPQVERELKYRWRVLQSTMDSKYPAATGTKVVNYGACAAAIANLQSHNDSSKLPPEEKESS